MKKYQKIFAFLIVFMFMGTTYFYYDNYVKESGIVKVSEKKNIKSNSSISMMYETEAGSGEYIETDDNSWPSGGYKFNATLSKCEKGSTISWDNTNKKILVNATNSDKCYVYFDIFNVMISNYIKSLYTTDGENNLYLHDSDLTNGANDGSYRYAGASESVNNYVCFASDAEVCPDDNLYRIIGVFGEQVKIIKSDYATSEQLGTDGGYNPSTWQNSEYSNYKGSNIPASLFYWNNIDFQNIWVNSPLNTINLNVNYINYLNGINTNWADMIAETTWQVGGNTFANISKSAMNLVYQNEIVNSAENTTYKDEIGLMYVSDYGYAASPTYWTYKGADTATTDYRVATNSNWMYMGLREWTITRESASSSGTFVIGFSGNVTYEDVGNDGGYSRSVIRPVFYLKSTVGYNGIGDGSKASPYRLVEPKPTFADHIKGLYTIDGENGLYLHDIDLENGANDGSYRYAGASEDVKNFVCFGSDAEVCPTDNLYRMIGVFDDQVKLIKYDYATSEQLGTDGAYSGANTSPSELYKGSNYNNITVYYWNNVDGINTWSTGTLNTVNLNTNYINYLNNNNPKWTNMIEETTWQVGGLSSINSNTVQIVYNNEIKTPSQSIFYKDKIGLMYASDYGYAAAPSNWSTTLGYYDADSVISSNWMYMGLYEWTITGCGPASRSNANIIHNYGRAFFMPVTQSLSVRPVFYIKYVVQKGAGNGTKESPYRLIMPK